MILQADSGYRSSTAEDMRCGPTVELDHIGVHDASRYICEVETGSAIIELNEAHSKLLQDFLELKLGRVIYTALPKFIVWRPEGLQIILPEAILVDDIRTDSEVLWSVLMAFCTGERYA